MSFNPVDGILQSVEKLPAWDSYQQYCRLIESWQKVVDAETAQRTRPLYISRNVLWVATASAPWAQTLSLRRQSLLVALNSCLDAPLEGIRFSSVHWSRTPPQPATALDRAHPSQIPAPESDPPSLDNPSATPQAAFQRWAERLQRRSRHLIACPLCQLPAPPGEIERWSCCAYCMRQQWGNAIASSPIPSENFKV